MSDIRKRFPPTGPSKHTANVYRTKTSAHDRQNEEVTMDIFYFKMHVKHL